MKERVLKVAKPAGLTAVYLMVAAVAALAQSGPFSGVAQGVSTEVIAAVKWGAIVVAIGCGISIAVSHQHGVMGRAVGAIFGLFIALNPATIVGWIQQL